MTYATKKYVNGELVDMTAQEIAEFQQNYAMGLLAEQQALLTAYIDKRAEEYPSINDYIDGVVKGDQAQVQAYIDACLAVKAKYPKPTQE